MILTGKRKLSVLLAAKIAEFHLSSEREKQYFKTMVAFDKADSEEEKKLVLTALEQQHPQENVEQLKSFVFNKLAHWSQFAILELIRTRNGKSNPRWLSANLLPKITVSESRMALEKLAETGLLTKKYVRSSKTFKSVNDEENLEIRKIQSQLMDLAKRALREQPLEKRDISSHIVATNSKKLKRAKKMIEEFRRDLTDFLEDEDADLVVSLNTQLFLLSKYENIK